MTGLLVMDSSSSHNEGKMGLFGGDDTLFDDPKFKQQMLRRIRQRMLESVKEKAAAGGGHAEGPGGMMEHMSPEDSDYFVDITRKDLPDVNPLTGKPEGWSKNVHRYKKKRAAT